MKKTGVLLLALVILASGSVSCEPATSMPPPTPGPLPSIEEVLRQYDEEVRPLAERLQTAQDAPPDFKLPRQSECQIILVPLSESLYYVQTLLSSPEWTSGDPAAPAKLYVSYTYERRRELWWEVIPGYPLSATQEVLVGIQLVAEVEGEFYLVETQWSTGGEGSETEQDLVTEAVRPLEALGNRAEEVESILETIVSYATGVDLDTSGDLPRRLALLQWALTSPYWADRGQAAKSLGQIGPEEGVAPALIQTLEDESWYVRLDATEALESTGPEEGVVPALIQALGDPNENVRKRVITVLGSIQPGIIEPEEEESVPTLIQALTDEMWERRAAAARLLAQVSPRAEEAIPALIQALGDESVIVRTAAAEALGDIGLGEGVAPALIHALEDEHEDVRQAAAEALGGFGLERGVVPALAQTLEDEDEGVRRTATEALRRIGLLSTVFYDAKEAIPALILALENDDEDVRHIAAEGLTSITGQNFGEDAAAWQAWWEAQQ